MKLSMGAAGIAAIISLAGVGSAGAAAPPGNASMRAERIDPVVMAQKKLESLGKNLYLKPGQQNAWQTYVSAMTRMAREHTQERAGRWQERQHRSEHISTPDRLDLMIERMRNGAEKLAKVAGETRTFYAQLSPEQKTIFDLEARQAHHERLRQHKPAGLGALR